MKFARNVSSCLLAIALGLVLTGCIVIQTEKVHFVPRAPKRSQKQTAQVENIPSSQPAEEADDSPSPQADDQPCSG